MNNSYISKGEALMLDNLMPGNQNVGAGSKLRNALNLGMGFKDGHKFYVDFTYGSDSNDGLSWDTPFKLIQTAVNAATSYRGDVVFVAPCSKIQEQVVVTKAALKIIAPWGGWTTRMRPGDGAIKYPFTPSGGSLCGGAAFICLAAGIEISGFCLDGGGNYVGAYVGDGHSFVDDTIAAANANVASCRFNNNLFYAGNDAYYGLVIEGSSDDCQVMNNVFGWTTSAGIYECCGGGRTNQRTLIQGNNFVGCMTYGVLQTNDVHYNTMVRGNAFYDRLPGTTAMTYSCRFQGPWGSFFVENFDATNAGALGSSTDFMAGNFEKHAMNSPVYAPET